MTETKKVELRNGTEVKIFMHEKLNIHSLKIDDKGNGQVAEIYGETNIKQLRDFLIENYPLEAQQNGD